MNRFRICLLVLIAVDSTPLAAQEINSGSGEFFWLVGGQSVELRDGSKESSTLQPTGAPFRVAAWDANRIFVDTEQAGVKKRGWLPISRVALQQGFSDSMATEIELDGRLIRELEGTSRLLSQIQIHPLSQEISLNHDGSRAVTFPRRASASGGFFGIPGIKHGDIEGHLWNIENGESLLTLGPKFANTKIHSGNFAGSYLVLPMSETFHVFSAEDGKYLFELNHRKVQYAKWFPQTQLLLTVGIPNSTSHPSSSYTAKFWDISEGVESDEYVWDPNLSFLALSPDGKFGLANRIGEEAPHNTVVVDIRQRRVAELPRFEWARLRLPTQTARSGVETIWRFSPDSKSVVSAGGLSSDYVKNLEFDLGKWRLSREFGRPPGDIAGHAVPLQIDPSRGFDAQTDQITQAAVVRGIELPHFLLLHNGNELKVWEPTSGRVKATFDNVARNDFFDSTIHFVEMENPIVVVNQRNRGVVQQLDPSNLSVLKVRNLGAQISGCALASDGRLAVGVPGVRNQIKILSTPDLVEHDSLQVEDAATCLDFSSNGNQIAYVRQMGRLVECFNLTQRSHSWRRVFDQEVRGIQRTASGGFFIAHGRVLSEVGDDGKLSQRFHAPGEIYALAVLPGNDQEIALALQSGSILRIGTQDWNVKAGYRLEGIFPREIEFTPDGTQLVILDNLDGNIYRMNLESGASIYPTFRPTFFKGEFVSDEVSGNFFAVGNSRVSEFDHGSSTISVYREDGQTWSRLASEMRSRIHVIGRTPCLCYPNTPDSEFRPQSPDGASSHQGISIIDLRDGSPFAFLEHEGVVRTTLQAPSGSIFFTWSSNLGRGNDTLKAWEFLR